MDSTSKTQYITEIARLFPRRGEWRESDYFLLPDSNYLVELSDGEVIMNPPPSTRHQRIAGKLYRLLSAYVEAHDLGEVFIAPLAVRLWEGKIREPDVLFYTKAHNDRIGEQISGPPDWVAEVISPGTRRTDEVDKLAEYAQAGVSEYWLIDPDARMIRVYVLEQDKTIYAVPKDYGIDDIIQLTLIPDLEIVAAKLLN